MISAKEAKKMMPFPSVGSELKAIEAAIKIAAANGRSSIRYTGTKSQFASGDLYSGKYPSHIIDIIAELRKFGYSADIKCEEKQFVDIYLFINWGDA